MKKLLKIGTRGSPLAMAQTQLLIDALKARDPGIEAEIVKIITSGDRIQDRPLSEVGGKGLFTKEIEDALLDGSIDCAVHSMKDMPTQLPDGLVIPCLLPREDVRDAFLSPKAKTIDDLPQGAVVGTSSLRRQIIMQQRRPDLKIVTFRGNVNTRLKKLEEGLVDATLLAVAGLSRLGLAHVAQQMIPTDIMLPAVAQAAVGIEIRDDNIAMRDLLATVHCTETELRVATERAYLAVMDGSCKTPLAALLSVPDAQGRARFEALAARPDGSKMNKVSYDVTIKTVAEAEETGRKAGLELKEKLAG